jgi:biotin-dependent carboxylase-like uncharacterized protein
MNASAVDPSATDQGASRQGGKPHLRVLAPGLLTTVQDLGRPGYQHLGIPPGGALDPVSLRAANALVGNPPGAAALEVAYVGPTLEVEAESVRVAIAGGEALIEVQGEDGAAARVEPFRSLCLLRGEKLRIGSLARATVLYLAVEGGLDVPPVLGSASTYIRGRLGGLNGRALAAGDKIPLTRAQASARGECRLEGLDLSPPRRIRVIAGPQSDYFSDATVARFFASEYTVAAGSDRMGMRLDGPPLEHARGFNITSDGIATGSIQVPGDGKPIVLLADRQTTGGYPKIATVISADWPALGRLPIGAKLAFTPVTIETAEAARRALYEELNNLSARIVPLEDDVAARLLDSNLISGVADARTPVG